MSILNTVLICQDTNDNSVFDVRVGVNVGDTRPESEILTETQNGLPSNWVFLGTYNLADLPSAPTEFWSWDAVNNLIVVDDTQELLTAKTEAKRLVDEAAEQARLRYVTTGSAQAMVYQEKSDEAADYAAAGYPIDLTTYPFIQAEVNATGKTSQQAADDILSQRSAWIAIGAQIEQDRLTGKMNIDAATTIDGINSARDSAINILNLI